MKIALIILLCGIMATCTTITQGDQKTQTTPKETPKALPQIDLNAKYRHVADSLRWAYSNTSTQYMFLVDYSIPSNKPRFFVWDYNKNKIVLTLWCAHGFGGGSTEEKPVFSNTVGSNCSSLGLFIVDRGQGQSPNYGYMYHAMDGMDASNSNARRRQLLIHTWYSVTEDSIAKIKTPMYCDYRSAGCFTLTERGYNAIHKIITSSSKAIKMYSFDGI